MDRYLQCGRFRFSIEELNKRPLVMGILNVTPDSFSDGAPLRDLNFILDKADAMIQAGADIIDIGGESTRPGAVPVPLDQELERIMPVIYALSECGKPLSVDTYKPEVMREVQVAGVDMINDVYGFRMPGALEAVKYGDCALCIMHMQNTPETMQQAPRYDDIVLEVSDFFSERIKALQALNVEKNRLLLDVGFGFGKTLSHNLTLLKQQRLFFERFGVPILAGVSRKSMLGTITGKPVEGRMPASLGAAMIAVMNGANVIRVHDVDETVDAIKVWSALQDNL